MIYGKTWGCTAFQVYTIADNTEIIDDLLSEAKEHDLLESKNYCISGSRDEVLIYLQAWEAEWDNVQIDKVNYSKFG